MLNYWRPPSEIPRPPGCVPLKFGGPLFQIGGHGGSITVLPRFRLTRRWWLTPESAPLYSDNCCWTSYTKTALTSTTRHTRTQVSKLFQRINFFFLFLLCERSSVRSPISTGSPCRISIHRRCVCRELSHATHLARRLEFKI